MAPAFELNHDKLGDDARLSSIAAELRKQSPINSREAFNRYCREACRLWNKHFEDGGHHTSSRFDELLGRVEQGGKDVIKTAWGGVVITLHKPPRVEKYLVIRKGGYLALEKHEQKDERLEVKEGAGLILWRRAAGEPLMVERLAPRDHFHFEPGMEHCLIGTEDLLMFERSIDPKGMDKDLVFIYEPDVA